MHTHYTPHYTERRGYDGMTVSERAAKLYHAGYRIELGGIMGVTIISPEKRRYPCNPLTRICTCPSFSARNHTSPCKHILGAPTLAIHQANAMCWEALEYDLEADTCRTATGYDAIGLELRARAVDLCDRAQSLRFWAEIVMAAQAGDAAERIAA